MIEQTLFGRLLCRLGLHLVIVASRRDHDHPFGSGSAHGGCLRCNRQFQWDW